MSVLIKGLIMPSCCDGCTFSAWSNLHQTASCKLHDYAPCFADHSREYTDKRADFCPLVEIPEPHGDLIDRDALEADICPDWNGLYVPDNAYSEKLIRNAPPIIEAEGSEDDADN